MNKSYNDITRQAERIIAMNLTLCLFKDCKGRPSEAEIWQLAAKTRAQHGISRFCKDKDEKRPCITPFEVKAKNHVIWWNTKEWKEQMERYSQESARRNAECEARKQIKDPCEGMTMMERITWCVNGMHNMTVADLHIRILDMMKRSMAFGVSVQEYGQDPLKLVRLVYADSKRILDRYNETHPGRNAYQLCIEEGGSHE